MWPRILPFACYTVFIAIHSILLSQHDSHIGNASLWLDPIKIAFVTILLIVYRREYTELNNPFFINFS